MNVLSYNSIFSSVEHKNDVRKNVCFALSFKVDGESGAVKLQQEAKSTIQEL